MSNLGEFDAVFDICHIFLHPDKATQSIVKPNVGPFCRKLGTVQLMKRSEFVFEDFQIWG